MKRVKTWLFVCVEQCWYVVKRSILNLFLTGPLTLTRLVYQRAPNLSLLGTFPTFEINKNGATTLSITTFFITTFSIIFK
jgi:hypothetical protein